MDSEQYIARYEPLVKKIAGKYYQRNRNNGICLDDLWQEGRIAVWKACGYPSFQGLSEIDSEKYMTRAISLSLRNYVTGELSPCSWRQAERSDSPYEWANTPTFCVVEECAVTDEDAHDELAVDEFTERVAHKDSTCGKVLRLLYNGETWDGVASILHISKRDVQDKVSTIRSIYEEYTLGEAQAA